MAGLRGPQAPHPGKTPKVYQYSFEQPNPFQGQFTGVADHALDLAYLHGDIGIFEGTLQPQNKEWLFGYDVKTKWIEFADGEQPWDHGKVMQFGPNYASQEMELNTFLTEKWKSANWAALDLLTFEEKEKITPLILAHLGQMNGLE